MKTNRELIHVIEQNISTENGVEQFIKADRGRVSQPLQKEQSRRHAGGGLIPPLLRHEVA